MKKEVIRHHFSLIDSTNHWLKEHCDTIPETGIVLVTADEQIAGRGRQGHLWKSPKGVNLYASYGFKWDRPTTTLPLTAAVAVACTLEQLDFAPQLKWPNDLLLHQKKVGGILCEKVGDTVIIGIGLNVNMTKEQLDEIDKPATSLLAERNASFKLEEVESLVTTLLIDWLEKDPFEAYQKRLAHHQGDRIAFHDGGTHINGVFEGLDPSGFLKLRLDTGEVRTFSSGYLD